MRVISGIYKGFNLKSPKSDTTRPTDNKVKEAIFDMLYPIKTTGYALDLFSGSGQMGIEFISRGLSKVFFNEKDRNAFKVIEENLGKIKADSYELSKLDFKSALEAYKNKGIKFDYIFLDPPYDTNFLDQSIKLIVSYELLNDYGIIITESDKELKFDEKYNIKLIKEKQYGRKIIDIYSKWKSYIQEALIHWHLDILI